MVIETKTTDKDSLIKALFAVGAHFGYSKSRSHPSVKKYIFGFKNRSAVIDLEKTVAGLDTAKEFIRGLAREGKQLVLVGNKDEARGLITKAAELIDMPYVASRWLGGTFTNFSQIKSRMDRLAMLKEQRASGELLEKYTKKERLLIDKEITGLERYLGSLMAMTKLPAAVLVVDADHERIVVTEASKVGVPVISISGSDNDIRGIAYPIVANDASTASIKFLLEELTKAYDEGRTQQVTPTPAPAAVAAAS